MKKGGPRKKKFQKMNKILFPFPFPFPFPVIPKNGGLWFPFPNFGNGFFHSLPVPEVREWIFSFPSHSRILGMDFFHSLPVPELWEWIFSIPFPFPNWPFQSRESKGKMGDFKRSLYSNIFSFLYISYNIHALYLLKPQVSTLFWVHVYWQ